MRPRTICTVTTIDLTPETCTVPSGAGSQANLHRLGIRQVLLDLIDWMFGEVLVDLGDDFSFHVRTKCLAQIGERAPRRPHDQRLRAALAPGPPPQCRHPYVHT